MNRTIIDKDVVEQSEFALQYLASVATQECFNSTLDSELINMFVPACAGEFILQHLQKHGLVFGKNEHLFTLTPDGIEAAKVGFQTYIDHQRKVKKINETLAEKQLWQIRWGFIISVIAVAISAIALFMSIILR